MAEKLTHIQLDEVIFLGGREVDTCICIYIPLADATRVARLSGRIDIGLNATDQQSLKARIQRLVEALRQAAGDAQYEIDHAVHSIEASPHDIRLYPTTGVIRFIYQQDAEQLLTNDLSDAQRRLFDSVIGSLTARCWEEIHRRVGAHPKPIRKPQVFVSYRSGHDEVAEAIARRLGQEGMIPWFDKWDVRAGDSLPGKIEEAFKSSMAFVPILTKDYDEGAWATEEMRTAIVKRIEDGFRIVPVLVEPCKRPELIRDLVFVDMSDRDPQKFETKMADLVDGIFALEANPFRST